MSIQNLIMKLQEFWAAQGCYLAQPYDVEVGAGTMTPDTFFRVIDKKSWNVAYVQPSRRPTDGRFGENPHRVQKHFQYQVVMKPSPSDPTIGAWGVGWQVLLDGLEITQFTYFQQAGGQEVFPVPVEITYGLERLEMFLEGVDNIYDLKWSEDVTYRDLRLLEEQEFSEYNFNQADINALHTSFSMNVREARRLIRKGLLFPAYDMCLKCSHIFNLLDSRGAISVTERVKIISQIRALVIKITEKYTAGKES